MTTTPAPKARGLASVLVPCTGPLALTQQVVASLARCTRGPWELVVVDDGSIDGTAAYLAGVRDVAPFPVTIVSHAIPQGNAACCRQALTTARGEYLILLDAAVVVTDAWLDQLVALADSDPVIGMTGPVSNNINPPQLVPDVSYANLDAMRQFAMQWRRERRGKWLEASRLSSACLLIKRRALDAAGGLGESPAVGGIDEEDLARRVHHAGFRMAVALDLFVHRAEGTELDATGPRIPPRVESFGSLATTGMQRRARRSHKIFGIGLPRTGTTSVAAAMMELGLRTGHACFDDAMFERGDAFFDTPVYVDYPRLDQRYPGSKFLLTWREPRAWCASFFRSLGPYFRRLRTESDLSATARIDRRCYVEAFGTDEPEEDAIVARYLAHRRRAEEYFRDRPDDLLILDLADPDDPWESLCRFLDLPRPPIPFPRMNVQNVDYWKLLHHANKL